MTEVELITMPKSVFEELWKVQQQQNAEKMQIVNYLSRQTLLQGVSEFQIYKMSFELVEVVRFYEKDVVFNDCEFDEKFHYIELKNYELKGLKNYKERLDFKFQTYQFMKMHIPGLFFITSGQIMLQTPTQWLDYTLQPGDYFGENLLFSTIGISRFGRLAVKSPALECYHINKNKFQYINQIDKDIMKKNARNTDYFKNCQQLLYKFYKTQQKSEEA